MTTIIGFADCGSVPLRPALSIRRGETSQDFAERIGSVYKANLTKWVNCHNSSTDSKVIALAGTNPIRLNTAPATFWFEMDAFIRDATIWVGQLANAARIILSHDLAQISTKIDNVAAVVSLGVDATLSQIEAQTNEIVDNFLIPIEGDILETLNVIEDIENDIIELIVSTDAIADDVIDGVEESIATSLSPTIILASEFIARTISDLRASLEVTNIRSNELLFLIKEEITSTVNAQIGIGASIDRQISALIEGLPKGFDDVFRSIGNDLLGNAGELGAIILDVFLIKGREKLDELFADFDPAARQIMNNVFTAIGGEKGVSPILRTLTNDALHNPIPIAGIALFTIGSFLVSKLMEIGSQPEQQLLLQEHSKLVSWNLPPIDALIAGFRREFIESDVLTDNAAKSGFSPESIKLFEQIDKLQLDASTIITLWLRKFITDDELTVRFNKLGFVPNDQDLLKAHSQIVPGVADLIRFMVRDVFSPEITAQFGQFEGFPEKFKELGEQIGLTEFWALNYWAAHWELPSITAGFEMLARGVIDDETFDILLKAKDVMPFWRDKVKAIAFNPFTRVDVRRMHKFGILDEAQVLQAYKDLRYDDDKAANLTAFTLKLNQPKETIEFSNPVETPQRQIEGFLKRGVINENDALGLLITLGFEKEDAELIVRSIDLFRQFEIRDEKIFDTIELGVLGAITPEQAEEELFKTGFETEEVARAIDKIHTGKQKKIKIPSLENLTEMAKKGIINIDVYQSALQNSGFSKDWAERLTQLFGV